MKTDTNRDTHTEALNKIADQLEKLTKELQEQNNLIRSVTASPNGRQTRLAVSMYGAVGVIKM